MVAPVKTTLGSTSAPATTLTAPVTSTAGNSLICAVSMYTGATQNVTGITDSAGNTWTSDAAGYQAGSNTRTSIWRTTQDKGPVTSITITASAALGMAAVITEWPGTLTVDAAATLGNAASTAPAACTVNATAAASLVVGNINYPAASGGTATPAAPWTLIATQLAASSTSNYAISAPSYLSISAAGTYGPSYTLSKSGASGEATVSYLVTGGTAPPQAGTAALSGSGTLTAAGTVGGATVLSRWAGVQTSDGFTVASRVTGATSVQLAVSLTADMATPILGTAVTPDTTQDGWCKPAITGLAADTLYYYQLQCDGKLTGLVGQARTLPATGQQYSFQFVAASCWYTNSTETVTPDLMRTGPAGTRPMFFVHLGDMHYSGNTNTDPAYWRGVVQNQFTGNASIEKLLAETPTYWIMSDHDTGPDNWSPGPGVQTPAYLSAYEGMAPFPTLQDPSNGIYYSFVVGRVRCIFTDSRSYRTSNTATDIATNGTILGATQKQWLKDQLLAPEPVKLWFQDLAWIYTGTQQNGDWPWFTAEQNEIADFITSNAVNVMMIHGDSHMLAADDGTNSAGNMPVWVCAPIDQGSAQSAGTYSNGKVYSPTTGTVDHHFGWFQVTDTGTQITVRGDGYDNTGTSLINMTTTFATTVAATGTASLTGSGSLTATGVPHSSATVALTGNGASTATGEPGTSGTAGMAGSGGLAASTSTRTTTPAAFTGMGSLAAVAVTHATGAAAFNGAGTLTATTTSTAGTTAAFSGAGVLTATEAVSASIATTFAGSGSLAATANIAANAAASLAGSGALAAVTVAGGGTVATFAGPGSLTATGVATGTSEAPLSGSGTLAVTAVVTVGTSASLNGSGTLTATGQASELGSATVALAGAGTLTADGAPASPGTASFTGTGTLAATGTASEVASGTADLNGTGTLTVVATIHADTTVTLSGDGVLAASGSGSAQASGTADLNGTGKLTADVTPHATGQATAAGSGALSVVPLPALAGIAQSAGEGTLAAVGIIPSLYIAREPITGQLTARELTGQLTARQLTGGITGRELSGTLTD